MKTYREEWTIVINNKKYVLNEEQAGIIRREIKNNNRGIVSFKNFVINISYIQEFYLSNKIYNVLPRLKEREISGDEKRRVRDRIEDFKKKFFKNHKL